MGCEDGVVTPTVNGAAGYAAYGMPIDSILMTTLRAGLRSLLPVLALLALGCSSVTIYPSSWAPVSAQGRLTCAAIVGDYKNRGIEVRKGRYIDDVGFQGRFVSNPSSATLTTHVPIERNSDDALTIGHWNGKDRIFEGEIACTDVVPIREYSSLTGFGALGVSNVIEQMFRADDGALIVSTSMDTKGVTIFLTPIVDHQDWWSRFEPYEGEVVPPVPDHRAAIVASLAQDSIANEASNEHNLAFMIIPSEATASPKAPANIRIDYYPDPDECRQRHSAPKVKIDGRPEYMSVETGAEFAFASSWVGRKNSGDSGTIISRFTPVEDRHYVVAYIMPGWGVELALYEIDADDTLLAAPLIHYQFTLPWFGNGPFCKGNVTYKKE